MISDLEEKEVCALCTKKPDFLTERSFRVNGLSGCGHKFCSSCIDHQFRTKDYFRCPKCQKSVRREQLAYKDIEEVEYERDKEKRTQIKRIFNKTEADFRSLEEYLDYEEMVEDIIYVLVKNEDSEKVKEALTKVEQYKRENATAIRRNAGRQEDTARQIDEEIMLEEVSRKEREDDFHRRLIEEMKQQENIRKIQDAVALGDTDLILNVRMDQISKKPKIVQNTSFTSGDVGWNPVIAFLNQRTEPQPVSSSSSEKKAVAGESNNNERKRKILAAGGYDYSFREKKGWKDIERNVKNLQTKKL